jgi:hypothetical protein
MDRSTEVTGDDCKLYHVVKETEIGKIVGTNASKTVSKAVAITGHTFKKAFVMLESLGWSFTDTKGRRVNNRKPSPAVAYQSKHRKTRLAADVSKKIIKSITALLEKMKPHRQSTMVKDAYITLASNLTNMQQTLSGPDSIVITEVMPDGSVADCDSVLLFRMQATSLTIALTPC